MWRTSLSVTCTSRSWPRCGAGLSCGSVLLSHRPPSTGLVLRVGWTACRPCRMPLLESTPPGVLDKTLRRPPATLVQAEARAAEAEGLRERIAELEEENAGGRGSEP